MFELDYRLVGRGWSEARIADGNDQEIVRGSYLSDALADLLEAVTLIAEGSATARCSFAGEPGEYRWVFDRSEDTVDVGVLAFEEWGSGRHDEAGTVVFRSRQPVLRVARAVLSAAQRVFDELGEDGYRAQWVTHPFPTSAMARLRDAIRSQTEHTGSHPPAAT